MRIGLDVDGVLTDMASYQLEYGKKYFLKKNPNLEIDETGYDICDIFHCTKAEREKFWTKYIWKYCLMPNRKHVKEMVDRLRAEGHEIHIITGRAHTTEEGALGNIFRKMLIWRLKKDGIKYDSIHFVSESGSADDKLKVCRDLKIDVLIDDKKENIEILDGEVECVCIDAPYNQDIKTSNYTRVNSIEKAYTVVEEISKKKADGCFRTLTKEEQDELSVEEKKEYIKNLRIFYEKLPYDEKSMKKQERHYKLLATIGIPIVKLIAKPNYIDSEKAKSSEGTLYVSNHHNYYDQFGLIPAIGKAPVHFLTATKMLNLKRGVIYRWSGAVEVIRKVDSNNPEVDAFSRMISTDKCCQILVHGGKVFVFPEGRTNREHNKINEFHSGATLMAQATGCPIIPMAHNGNWKKGEMVVQTGDKIYIGATDDIKEKTEEIKDVIVDLIDKNDEFTKTLIKK